MTCISQCHGRSGAAIRAVLGETYYMGHLSSHTAFAVMSLLKGWLVGLGSPNTTLSAAQLLPRCGRGQTDRHLYSSGEGRGRGRPQKVRNNMGEESGQEKCGREKLLRELPNYYMGFHFSCTNALEEKSYVPCFSYSFVNSEVQGFCFYLRV